MSNRFSKNELPTRSTTNTHMFLETCVLNADHKALKEHLVSNQVQQSDLDRCLLRVLQIVQWEEGGELLHMAPALTILLQSGAKWNSVALLDNQKTPLHIICESPGDHHELLDLMIKSSQRTIIDKQDCYTHPALMYAVKLTNINCIKCLIANRADLYLGDDIYQPFVFRDHNSYTPMMEAIWISSCTSRYSSVIISDIFDLLLNAALAQNKDHFRTCPYYIPCALLADNVHYVHRLIKMGAPLDVIANDNIYVWALVAREGDVELLKNMFNRGIDKNSVDQKGLSLLGHTVISGKIEAVRYLLDIGTDIPTYSPEVPRTQCEQCKENILIIEGRRRDYLDPCMRAIRYNKLKIIKLLDERGNQSCKSFKALRRAVLYNRVGIVSYLLNKYTYHLNTEYILTYSGRSVFTLLTESLSDCNPRIAKLLLDHGADPARPSCSATTVNAIMTAIYYGKLDIVAQYIRCGVDINLRSRDSTNGDIVSPFEASVLYNRRYVSVLLLISGCSRGVFSTSKLKNKRRSRLEKLMKKWNVYDDNVTPLMQRCRCVILNHLSHRADLKINIPELDDIVYENNSR